MPKLIKTENLSFAYDSRPILKGVSLTIEAGEFVGLIGANGSGKTTLLRLLLGMLRGKGTVMLDGTPLDSLPRKEIATRATMVHQDTRVDFAFAAREIVAMGRTPYLGRFTPEGEADREAISRAMRQTETESFAGRLIT
ncbi:MAG: ABC transporter ATP-binding protein, partial [Pyrinomonadaceae bacterium]